MALRSKRRALPGPAAFFAFAGLVACTEILGIKGDPPPKPPGDAQTDTDVRDGGKIDVDAAPRCNPDAAFGTPEAVPGLDLEGKDEYAARFTDDEQTVYFYYPAKDNHVQTARLESGRFTAPVPAINANLDSEHFALSADGSWAVFAARGDEAPLRDLYRAVPSPGGVWTVSDRLQLAGDQFDPYIGAKGEVLFAQDGDIQISLPSATFSFRTFQGISDIINTENLESDPVLSRDEKALYFSRDYNLGTIFVATRPSAESSAWTVQPPLFDKNQFPSQHPTWISPDGCHLYFSGVRRIAPDSGIDASSDTDNDIYVAKKPLF